MAIARRHRNGIVKQSINGANPLSMRHESEWSAIWSDWPRLNRVAAAVLCDSGGVRAENWPSRKSPPGALRLAQQ
jgi:hypothetical protein